MNNLILKVIFLYYHVSRKNTKCGQVKLILTSKLILIITVATNYAEGKTGSDTCTVGSAITDTHECKEACNELNRPVGALSEGSLCYVAGNGRCKQDGSMNPKGRLVCKMLGNMITHKT